VNAKGYATEAATRMNEAAHLLAQASDRASPADKALLEALATETMRNASVIDVVANGVDE
jgi:hypothetical protein